jgi:hypothetical protein
MDYSVYTFCTLSVPGTSMASDLLTNQKLLQVGKIRQANLNNTCKVYNVVQSVRCTLCVHMPSSLYSTQLPTAQLAEDISQIA